MDSVNDALRNGRNFRLFNVLDYFNCERKLARGIEP
jgi:hypothetical protein